MTYDHVLVPVGNLLGEAGHGLRQALPVLDGGRISIGALSVGLAQAAYEEILVVEDEAPLRAQLETQLRQAGYAVDSAADGEDGFYLGRENPLDLAVVDLGLPKLSGIHVIRRWRDAGRNFPILILTARGRWQDKVEGLEAGGDDYLVKPFHVEI